MAREKNRSLLSKRGPSSTHAELRAEGHKKGQKQNTLCRTGCPHQRCLQIGIWIPAPLLSICVISGVSLRLSGLSFLTSKIETIYLRLGLELL